MKKILILILFIILMSSNCFSINVVFNKKYDIFNGNQNISNVIIKDYIDGNYLVVFNDQQINMPHVVHFMIIDNDGNLLNTKHTDYEGYVQDVIINESGDFKILFLSTPNQAEYMYSFIQTLFVDNKFENLEYYSSDTLLRNNNYPKFYDFNTIIESAYNVSDDFPYLLFYTDKCELSTQKKIGVFPINLKEGEYIGRSNIMMTADNYIATFELRYKSESDRISTINYSISKEFEALKRKDLGIAEPPYQYKIYDIGNNQAGFFAVRYLNYSFFIKKENHFQCYNNALEYIYSTDTIPMVHDKSLFLQDGGLIVVYNDYVTKEYFIRRYNSLGKFDDELLFHSIFADSIGLGSFNINQTESGALFLSADAVYRGNDWVPEDNPFGYRTINIIKLDYALGVSESKSGFVQVYPNPASDYINIAIDKDANLFTREVQILNLLGLVVSKQELTDGNNRIDISHLARGTYFIKVGDKIEKFVKM